MMLEKQSLVTVVIPTHNRKELLCRAINSVLKQKYKNIELIIANDASNYDVENYILKKFGYLDNVIVVSNKVAQGACSARNMGISHANGDYITFLDDDDEYKIDHLDKLYNLFINNNYSFVSTSVVEFNGDKFKKRHYDYGEVNLNKLLHYNCIGNNIFTKLSYIKSVGMFDVEFPALQDYDLMIRLVEKYGKAFKTYNDTYIQYTDHNFERITHSNSKRLNALTKLRNKYSLIYTDEHTKSLSILEKKFKGECITISDVIKYINKYNYINLFALYKNTLFKA